MISMKTNTRRQSSARWNAVKKRSDEQDQTVTSSKSLLDFMNSNSTLNADLGSPTGPPVNILCLDGGGVKGITVVEMVAAFERATGETFASKFDLVAGTSMGGAQALLTNKFPEKGRAKANAEFMMNSIIHGGAYAKKKSGFRMFAKEGEFVEDNREDVFKYFFNEHEDLKNHRSPKAFAVATFEDKTSSKSGSKKETKPFLMRTYEKPDKHPDAPLTDGTSSIKMWEAAQFATASNTGDNIKGDNNISLSDGKAVASDPTELALYEALALFPDRPIGLVMSLGCGHAQKKQVDIVLHDVCRPDIRAMVEAVGGEYVRLNPYIGNISQSETKNRSLEKMRERSQNYFAQSHEVQRAHRLMKKYAKVQDDQQSSSISEQVAGRIISMDGAMEKYPTSADPLPQTMQSSISSLTLDELDEKPHPPLLSKSERKPLSSTAQSKSEEKISPLPSPVRSEPKEKITTQTKKQMKKVSSHPLLTAQDFQDLPAIDEEGVRALFTLWNSALATGDARIVAKRYASDPILLPTKSDEPRMDYEGIVDYFKHFLQLKPRGKIISGKVRTGYGWAKDAGIYEFTMGANGDRVKARYSFVYVYENKEWKIAHHHSSFMPESHDKTTISESEARNLFYLWNMALDTLDSDCVAKRYAKSAVLLPTVSDQPRTDYEGIKDYFDHFLQLKPQGEILESYVTCGENWCKDSGLYEFILGTTGEKVRARYSFVYIFEDGQWKIAHHHSSKMPEAPTSSSETNEATEVHSNRTVKRGILKAPTPLQDEPVYPSMFTSNVADEDASVESFPYFGEC